METKVLEKAKATLELYDTKFELTCDNLDEGYWLLEITNTALPQIGVRYWDFDNLYLYNEDEVEKFLWEQVLEFIQKYADFPDITFYKEEAEEE
jgi:hypothetical protein